MFDMLKCEEWNSVFDQTRLVKYKYLLIKDCYLPLELLGNIQQLRMILNEFYFVL